MARLMLVLPYYSPQNAHVGDLYMMDDEILRQTIERSKTPYTPFKPHMPNGQVKPIEEYFPKIKPPELDEMKLAKENRLLRKENKELTDMNNYLRKEVKKERRKARGGSNPA